MSPSCLPPSLSVSCTWRGRVSSSFPFLSGLDSRRETQDGRRQKETAWLSAWGTPAQGRRAALSTDQSFHLLSLGPAAVRRALVWGVHVGDPRRAGAGPSPAHPCGRGSETTPPPSPRRRRGPLGPPHCAPPARKAAAASILGAPGPSPPRGSGLGAGPAHTSSGRPVPALRASVLWERLPACPPAPPASLLVLGQHWARTLLSLPGLRGRGRGADLPAPPPPHPRVQTTQHDPSEPPGQRRQQQRLKPLPL